MTTESYLTLIENTITYIQELIPKKALSPLSPASPSTTNVEPSLKVNVTTRDKKTIDPTPALKDKQQIKQKKKPFLELHPPPCLSNAPSAKMKRLLQTIAPDLYIHDLPLSDEKSQRIKHSWKEKSKIPEIPILFQGAHYRLFLDNLAKAVSLCFFPCRVIDIAPFEKEKKWDIFLESPQLKIILCPDQLIFSCKELLPFYKENPGQKIRFLGKTPLLLLPDLSLYFKDPYLKRSLWNVICQTLS